MITYKRVVEVDQCTVIIETTSLGIFKTVKIKGAVLKAKKISNDVFGDNQLLWKHIETALQEQHKKIKADYIIIITPTKRYKIQVNKNGISILYNKERSKYYRTVYLTGDFSAFTINDWLYYFSTG